MKPNFLYFLSGHRNRAKAGLSAGQPFERLVIAPPQRPRAAQVLLMPGPW